MIKFLLIGVIEDRGDAQMLCPNCGTELPEGAKFCLTCGAPVATATPVMPQPTPPRPPVVGAEPFPQPTPTPKPKPKKPRNRKRLVIVIIVIASVLVIGGAVVGIIAWRVSAGNRLVAEIESVELERVDGRSLDLNRVPLDTQLTINVKFHARYKEGGKGTLTITNSAAIAEGESSAYTYDVKSSNDVQEKTTETFYMMLGTGKQESITAKLEVTKDDKEASDSSDLAYTTVAGKGTEIRVEEAGQEAVAKADEANKVLERAQSLGIDVSDLYQKMIVAATKVETNPSEQEINDFIATMDEVIQEGNARIAAAEQARADEQQAGQDEAACKQAMTDYAQNNWSPYEREWIESFSWNNSLRTSATGVIGVVGGDGSTTLTTVNATKSGENWLISEQK